MFCFSSNVYVVSDYTGNEFMSDSVFSMFTNSDDDAEISCVSFELLLCALSFFLELKEMTEETPAAIAIPITVQKISWDLV